jgi:hypothetical protein
MALTGVLIFYSAPVRYYHNIFFRIKVVLLIVSALNIWGLKQQGIAELASKARPWLIGSVVSLIVTGILLGLSEAIKVYYSTSFWVKVWGLLIAVVYTFAFRERIIRDEALDTSRRSRLVAGGSIGIWFVVAAAGRWIGFS